jgi:hypothetical protein
VKRNVSHRAEQMGTESKRTSGEENFGCPAAAVHNSIRRPTGTKRADEIKEEKMVYCFDTVNNFSINKTL